MQIKKSHNNHLYTHTLKPILIILLSFFLGMKLAGENSDLPGKKNLHGRETRFTSYTSEIQYELDVLHYYIDLKLFPDRKHLESEVTITATPFEKNLSQIDLNLHDNLKVASIFLNEKRVEFSHKGSKLSLKNIKVEKNDTVDIKIKYSGTPLKIGLSSFSFGKINGRSLVYTLNEPNNASTWIPCNDIPTDKSLMTIRIENDDEFVSVSNGILIEEKKLKDRKSFTWKTFYPIATYLICFYSGPYEQYNDKYIDNNNDTLPLNYFVLPEDLNEAKIDFEDHPVYLKVFEKLFGEYPFKKEKYGVAQFLWQLGAMEHQTITGIGSKLVTGKKLFSDVLIHEVAHHWWGNAVTPSSWDDIWLNEAFATYSEALYFEEVSGHDALVSTMEDKIEFDFAGTVYSPDDLFNATVYNKGAWVLHMLRNELSDEIFFPLLKKYFEEYKYKNISTEEFIDFCEEFSDVDLTQFFKQWIYEGEGIPRVKYTFKSVKRNGTKYLDVLLTQEENNLIYHLPIELEIVTADKKSVREKILLESESTLFSFPLEGKFLSLNFDPDNNLLTRFELK